MAESVEYVPTPHPSTLPTKSSLPPPAQSSPAPSPRPPTSSAFPPKELTSFQDVINGSVVKAYVDLPSGDLLDIIGQKDKSGGGIDPRMIDLVRLEISDDPFFKSDQSDAPANASNGGSSVYRFRGVGTNNPLSPVSKYDRMLKEVGDKEAKAIKEAADAERREKERREYDENKYSSSSRRNFNSSNRFLSFLNNNSPTGTGHVSLRTVETNTANQDLQSSRELKAAANLGYVNIRANTSSRTDTAPPIVLRSPSPLPTSPLPPPPPLSKLAAPPPSLPPPLL